jgi:hypothetical protein
LPEPHRGREAKLEKGSTMTRPMERESGGDWGTQSIFGGGETLETERKTG